MEKPQSPAKDVEPSIWPQGRLQALHEDNRDHHLGLYPHYSDPKMPQLPTTTFVELSAACLNL